jgi:aryl-alcohol dehydrogenase-like predicted oxidoreductase
VCDGGHVGRTEKWHVVVLATKSRFPMGSGPNDVGLSRRHLARALEASLRRLGVDRLDLYQVHAYDPVTPLEETLAFLDDAVRAGKVDYVGLSNFTGWQVQRAVQPAGSRDRVGDRSGVPGERAGPAAVVSARRRMADREVPPGRAADRQHPARGESGARRRGVRPTQHPRTHLGRR